MNNLTKATTILRIPIFYHSRLKRLSLRTGKTMIYLIAEFIKDGLKKYA